MRKQSLKLRSPYLKPRLYTGFTKKGPIDMEIAVRSSLPLSCCLRTLKCPLLIGECAFIILYPPKDGWQNISCDHFVILSTGCCNAWWPIFRVWKLRFICIYRPWVGFIARPKKDWFPNVPALLLWVGGLVLFVQ